MSEENGLPKGWGAVSLADLTSRRPICYGVLKPGPRQTNGVPLIRITDISADVVDESDIYLITDRLSKEFSRSILRGGEVLLSIQGTIGRTAICPQSLAGANVSRTLAVIDPDERVDRRFLRFWCLSRNGRFPVCGSTRASLNIGAIRDLLVPIAPLPEQHRIVAKIEELFSHLDAAVASLQRAKANLRRYRASVLKSAVEGRLTEDWRKEHPQAEDGRMLLDRILRERREKWERDQLAKFKEKGEEPPKNWQSKYVEPSAPDASELAELPEGWVWASLEAVSEVTGGITKDKKKDTLPGMLEVPYLRVANVQRGFLDLSDMKTIKASSEDIRELALRKGDVLFTEGGDRDKLGRGWVWAEELRECIHQNHIFRARLITTGFQPSLVSHHGNTFGREWFTKAGKQTTNLASINLGILERFPVPIAPLAEQQQIVALAEERLSQIDAAEKTIDAELIRAKRLRQSILKRAFEGKLVPQDPSDEPASVLLERIQLDRTKASRDGKRPTRPRRARRSP